MLVPDARTASSSHFYSYSGFSLFLGSNENKVLLIAKRWKQLTSKPTDEPRAKENENYAMDANS